MLCSADDDATGVPFHSIKYPNLKIMIHTGFDVIQGKHRMKPTVTIPRATPEQARQGPWPLSES
jgi:hypothetical protein